VLALTCHDHPDLAQTRDELSGRSSHDHPDLAHGLDVGPPSEGRSNRFIEYEIQTVSSQRFTGLLLRLAGSRD
jgi:hypothetical protein